jgi:protoporphyrinogen oxidase
MDHVAIVGGGFTGLGAAYELLKRGIGVSVYEADTELGGLAGTFDVQGTRLEKFYHHWFNNDSAALAMVRELGLADDLVRRSSNTGTYYGGTVHRLAKPMDLLRFQPLSFSDRVRLGKLALAARRVSNWRDLEKLTAREWLVSMAGRRVYDVIWEPLLVGKFGDYAGDISAVWMWNKLRLRGGSRGSRGQEELCYLRGGFQTLIEALANRISELGGEIRTGTPVRRVSLSDGCVSKLVLGDQTEVTTDGVLLTVAPQIVSDMLPDAPASLMASLGSIPYLAAQCVVLQLDRSLSSTYWLNVNDRSAPFVGVIEHTNFENSDTYGGRHIVYLARYLPRDHREFTMGEGPLTAEYLDHLNGLFPDFRREWVIESHVWRAAYSQPIVLRDYSSLIPPFRTEVDGLWLCNMSQIYPEDRGTNYALSYGTACASEIAESQSARLAA